MSIKLVKKTVFKRVCLRRHITITSMLLFSLFSISDCCLSWCITTRLFAGQCIVCLFESGYMAWSVYVSFPSRCRGTTQDCLHPSIWPCSVDVLVLRPLSALSSHMVRWRIVPSACFLFLRNVTYLISLRLDCSPFERLLSLPLHVPSLIH